MKTKDFLINFYKKMIVKLAPNWRLANLLPYFIFALFFILIPLVFLLQGAAEKYPLGQSFKNVAHNTHFWKVMWDSVWLGLLASFISLLIMFPFVWIVSRSKNKIVKIVLLTLMLSPLLVFTIAKVFALKGLLLAIFDAKDYNNAIVKIIGMVYLYSPFMVVPLYSVLSTMPKSLLEASADLGQGSLKTIFKVIIPYAMKGIFAGLALVFMLSATNLVISQSLLLGGQTAPKQVGNLIDAQALKISLSATSRISASTMSLITIFIMASVYALITFTPQLIRKLRGGVNV